jgi:hypothetical protein
MFQVVKIAFLLVAPGLSYTALEGDCSSRARGATRRAHGTSAGSRRYSLNVFFENIR